MGWWPRQFTDERLQAFSTTPIHSSCYANGAFFIRVIPRLRWIGQYPDRCVAAAFHLVGGYVRC
jgi:hypothetical protein